MSRDEHRVRTKQKKLAGKRRAESWQQQQIIVSNFPQMFLNLNSWKIQLHQLQTASNVIIFPFNLAASVAQWSRPCRWSRFDWSPTTMAPVVINRYTISQFFLRLSYSAVQFIDNKIIYWCLYINIFFLNFHVHLTHLRLQNSRQRHELAA